MQLLTNFGIFPAVKLLSPGALYQPELAPSPELTFATLGTSLATVLVATLVWRDRIAWRAPAEQEREAEAELAGTA
jgi:hypothetical protein